ncbi:MAG: hypothetical protein JNK45_20455 [Myxococcales bacterium]|nr:hypothetical protein [Myxococcales bacterium]
MIRRLLAAALTVALAVPSVSRPAFAAAAFEPTAEELYDQGRTAYRLGKFKDAVVAWEKSYDLSNGNPLLLYNIALAYRGLFGITDDIKDLRQAETVMRSFVTVAEADPALQGELADARARHAEFVAEIAAEEEKQAAAGPSPQDKAFADEQARRAAEEKRSKKLRLAGAVTMGVGGGVFLAGATVGTLYLVKSKEFTDQVRSDRAAVTAVLQDPALMLSKERVDRCVEDKSVATEALDAANDGTGAAGIMNADCRPAAQELADLAQTRINGKKANAVAIVGFAVIGGIGLAALIAGAVVFAQGNRVARGGRQARVQIAPSFGGRAGNGFVLHGRF